MNSCVGPWTERDSSVEDANLAMGFLSSPKFLTNVSNVLQNTPGSCTWQWSLCLLPCSISWSLSLTFQLHVLPSLHTYFTVSCLFPLLWMYDLFKTTSSLPIMCFSIWHGVCVICGIWICCSWLFPAFVWVHILPQTFTPSSWNLCSHCILYSSLCWQWFWLKCMQATSESLCGYGSLFTSALPLLGDHGTQDLQLSMQWLLFCFCLRLK